MFESASPEQVEACASAYVDAKFHASAKKELRTRLWPGVSWSFHLVHGVVRCPEELEAFARQGVACHPFHQLLFELSRRDDHSFSGSAGGDLAEIISYYRAHEAGNG